MDKESFQNSSTNYQQLYQKNMPKIFKLKKALKQTKK